jgi:tetraacyldisaccharide 4'-kinase
MQSPAQPGLMQTWLTRAWWQPRTSALARLLAPLSALYLALAAARRARPATLPVPVLVVGNLVVGGAGKTPIVIALVQALAAAGWKPGVVSRGHGRREQASTDVIAVDLTADAAHVGDEPLLIRRRTGAPVFVGRRRVEAARALCAAHPEVDVIVSDDGLQHHALPRTAQVIVFDDRGAGNGRVLPAGPLREPLPAAVPRDTFVVYSGSGPSTPLPGWLVPRRATRVAALAAWAAGGAADTELISLRGRRLVALAGIGAPQQFFAMLGAAGLDIKPLPCADHAAYAAPPWPAGTAEVITTEKDAVKLARLQALDSAATRVWVLPLDCELPPALFDALTGLLTAATAKPS